MRKNLFRRVTSVALASIMTFTTAFTDFSGALTAKAADVSEATAVEQVSTSTDYNLADNIQDGVILHCFDWKYNDIKAELPNIAASGFTTVQTSPAQVGAGSGVWYWLYQPLGFYVGSNAVGTKDELASLCSEADKYGIKVVVDVVANHLAGDHSNIQSDLKDSQYWHNHGDVKSYSDRYEVTHGDIGMADINSENSYVQQAVAKYVKELKDLGVDGIRWDAAKHIALPSEGCDFWPAVTKEGLYNYGEILVGPDDRETGNEGLMKEYTNYMTVTDSSYGKTLREAFNSGNVPTAYGNWSARGISNNKLIYWGESHDTWCNNKDWGYSNEMSQNVIDRAYAVAASRNQVTALYYSRPSSPNKDSIIGGQKGSTHFTSKEVAAVNHFHNAMIGQKDYYTTGGGCAVVSREKGAVIVKGSGSGSVSVPNGGGTTAPGEYTDEITGNKFTVTSTTISGEIGSTGIAVVYNAKIEPTATITPGSQKFKTDTLDLTIGLKNATSGTYQVGSDAAKTYTADTKITIGSDMQPGDSVTIKLTATDGKETTGPNTYTYTKADSSQTYTAYIDKPSDWNGTLYCYAYDDTSTKVVENAAWPGVEMEKDSETGYYKCDLPDTMESPNVIFNTGKDGSSRYPADKEPGLTFTSSSMIYKDGKWEPLVIGKQGTVTVKYVDESGKELADSTTLKGTVGNSYNATAKTISGYKVKTTPSNASGKYTEAAITVTYVYEAGEIITTGNVLYAVKPSGWSKIYCYAYDDTTSSSTIRNGAWPGVEMTMDSESGYYKYDIPESVKEVKVIVTDNAGNQVPGANQAGMALSGSMLFKDGKLEPYIPPVTTGNVTAKFVDEDGAEIASSVKTTGNIGDAYTTTAANVDGYTLTTTPSNATGTYTKSDITVTYVYKSTALSITSSLADGSTFSTETATTTVKIKNATSGTYCVDNGPVKTFTDSADVVLGQGKIADTTVTLDVTATDGTNTKKVTYTFTKKFSGKAANETLSAASALSLAAELSAAGNAFASKYYSTNATGIGTCKTITSASDWAASDMIAQGVANDDSNVFKGPHEYSVYDEYGLYAAYDDSNVYIGWQYVDVRDVTANWAGNGAGTMEAKPYNAPIPQMLALDLGSANGTYSDGTMDATGEGKNVWGIKVGYKTNVNALLCFSSKKDGTPALFTTNSEGQFSYGTDYCKEFKSAGISYAYEDGLFAGINNLYGINMNAYTGYHTDMLYSNDSAWTDLNAAGHNTKLDTFYTIKIPYSSLGITKDYVAKKGIGIMHISTFGESGVASIPADDSMYDVAEESYSKDTSSTAEKEDTDVITASLARLGGDGVTPPEPLVDDLTVNFGADRSSPQLNTTALTLKAIAKGGVAEYNYEFFVDGNSVQASTADSYTWNPVKGNHSIKVVVTDSKGTTVTSQKNYTIEGESIYKKPEVTSFTSNVTSIKLGNTATFSASAINGEGTLTYKFTATDANNKEELIKDYSTAATATWTPSAVGKYTVKVTVKDGRGTEATKEIKDFTVDSKPIEYVAPSITSFSTDVSSVKLTGSVTLKSAAKDGEGTLEYMFTATDANNKETVIKEYSAAATATWTPAAIGTYTLRVYVKDVKNVPVSKDITGFKVIDNNVETPSIKGFAANVATIAAGNTATLAAEATGGVGTLSYKFAVIDEADNETVIRKYAASSEAAWTPAEAGTYTLKVYVKDANGTEVSKTVSNFVVTEEVEKDDLTMDTFKTSIASGKGEVGNKIKLTAKASGGEGELLYKFVCIYDDESKVLRDYSSKRAINWVPSEAGTYKLYVYVTDEAGAEVVKSIKKYVVDEKPLAIRSFKANGLNAITAGKSVKLKLTSDGGVGTVKYKFTYKAITSTKATVIKKYNTKSTVAWKPAESGIYKLTAYAKDEDGTVVRQSFYFVVL